MSATMNTRIQFKRDNTANWNAARGFVPLQGEIIIYEDYEVKTYTIEEYGEEVTKTVNIPNIKIGTGREYVQDLPFVDEKLRDILMEHINDMDMHVTLGEKTFWNNKLNVNDAMELVEGSLVFNRN